MFYRPAAGTNACVHMPFQMPPIANVLKRAPALLEKATTIPHILPNSTVRLAVTGLSRVGKTVFITSLIHNLLAAALAYPNGRHRMPLLKVAGEGRLISASLQGAAAQKVPQFPYKEYIAGLAAVPPAWPARTADVSETEIDIRFTPGRRLSPRRILGGIVDGATTLRLTLVDYPGEWLLDLALLRQNYVDWSRAIVAMCRRGVRGELARDWLGFLASHPHDEVASEETAKRAHDLYRFFLLEARNKHGLSYLQPGRFITAGIAPESEPPYLWFCPLDLPAHINRFTAGSFAALMEARFDAYRKEAVEKFFREHFQRFDRQIVLVDVLRALLAGEDAFEDACLALEHIIQSYRFGSSAWLASLLGARITRVLFAATKADHVSRMQRDHLAQLLADMSALPSLQARQGSAETAIMPVASVLCTEDGTDTIGQHTVDVVVGKPLGRENRINFFPGPIPIKRPKAGNWNAKFLDIPVFQPPQVSAVPTDGIPHINLDAALDFLIGDRLS